MYGVIYEKKIVIIVLLFIFFGAVSEETSGIKKEAGMGGIIFFKTQKLTELKDFYVNRVGCLLWMDQMDCLIFKYGNMLFGFCRRDKADIGGMVTFFYKKKDEVDEAYKKFKSIALSIPRMNEKYRIYHFFAIDPEGRYMEFQYFGDKINWDFNRFR